MKENKEKVNKLIVVLTIMIAILGGAITNQSQAVNETDSNISNTTNTTSTNSSMTTEKSSNANLSNLGIRPHDFTGFKYGTTSYEVSVPEDTETVEVYATAQSATAKIAGTGRKTLEKGENLVQITVTAEDGTKKTYTINIIREIQQEAQETSNEIESSEEQTHTQEGKGLAELKINNLELMPTFKTNIYEYTIKYIGEDTKLNIETKTTEEDYEVEVIGNHNLKEGENIITLLVSEKNGDNVATYQVTVDKSLVDEEEIARKELEKKEKEQKIMIGIVGAVVIVVVIVVIIIRRRNRRIEEEFLEEDFYGNSEDEEEDDMPRTLKGRRYEAEEIEDEEFEQEDEYEDFESMSKDKVKEQFLNGYNSRSRNGL